MNKNKSKFGTFLTILLILSSCGEGSSFPSFSESQNSEDSSEHVSIEDSEPISEENSDTSSKEETSGETNSNLGTFGIVPSKIYFYYFRDDQNYNDYRIWWWIEGLTDGVMPDWTARDEDFAVLEVEFSAFPTVNELGIILRKATTWSGQSPDFIINFKDYPTKDDGTMDIYVVTTDSMAVESYLVRNDALGDKIANAEFTSFKQIKVTSQSFNKDANGKPLKAIPNWWRLYKNGALLEEVTGSSDEVTFNFQSSIQLTDDYEVRASFPDAPTKIRRKKVKANALFDTNEFINNYTYDGKDLGFTYTKNATTFKVWAPTASKVELHLFKFSTTSKESGSLLSDIPTKIIPMTYANKGVYQVTVNEDLDGMYYMFSVTNIAGTQAVNDPYAVSAGVNGHRSQVINWDSDAVIPEGYNDLTFEKINGPNDLTVYEMHIQDLTLDDSWTGVEQNRGKYLGLIEKGTTYTEGDITVSTGFDHIKELGVNAVQIMPFYDQANQEYFRSAEYPDEDGKYYNPAYNWGYNPYNYNVVDGGYSSSHYDGRVSINEFRQVVQAFGNEGIRVIMDVVYNHVASFASSPFQRIVPDYYFRYNEDGTLKAESGVGNDTASERIMFENYIVDSVSHWASKFNIKGFRFDLMSLITPTTLRRVEEALKAIDPSIVVWGEPWSGGGYAGPSFVYDGSLGSTGVAAFNDIGRNALKGDNNLNGSGSQYGWLQKEPAHNAESWWILNNIKGMLAGQMKSYYEGGSYTNPLKSVNYAGCHDNFTLYDHLFNTMGDAELAKKASIVGNALVLTAQGTPFFQGGDEILRSKPFDPTTTAGAAFVATHANEMFINKTNGVYYSGNSYNLEGSVNSYKWADKVKYLDVFELYKQLISLRLNNEAYKLSTATEVKNNFGYWEDVDDLSYSAIASWNTKQADSNNIGALYHFYTGKLYGDSTSGTSANTTQEIRWGTGNVEVVFDSLGKYNIGQVLTGGSVKLDSYHVLIVRRVTK